MPSHSVSARRHAARFVLFALLCGVAAVVPAARATAAESALVVVDAAAPGASDDAAGDAEHPLATIGEGVRRAQAYNAEGVPVRILVGAGTYRESVELQRGGQQTEAPIVLQGARDGGTVITGADRYTAWTPAPGGLFVHAWSHRFGASAMPDGWGGWWEASGIDDVLLRRELVVVNGQPLRQVTDRGRLAAEAGTFLVDEALGQLVVHAPAGVDLRQSGAEVAVRPVVLAGEGLVATTIRDLVVRHAASPVQGSAVRIGNSRGLVVDGVRVEQNAWAGLSIVTSSDVTIRRSAAVDNGVMGFSAFRVERIVLEDSENSRNNWRGADAGFTDWDTGSKFVGVRDMVVRRYRAVGNRTHGLWFDHDNARVVIEDVFVAENDGLGVFLEASQGPIEIRGSTICRNAVGVRDGRSDNVTLTGNRIFANDVQISFSGDSGGRPVTPWDGGETLMLRSRGWTITSNLIGARRDGDELIGNTLQAEDWSAIRADLRSDGNRWFSPRNPTPFRVPGSVHDFTGWQQETAQDAASTFSARGTAARCSPTGKQPGARGAHRSVAGRAG